MWNPPEFNSESPSYLDSDYSFNSFPDDGSESSSNLPISNEYDNLFLDDWLPSDMSEFNSVDCHVNSGIDLSSSSLSFSPFPSIPSNSYSYSYSDPTGFNSNIVGEGSDNSMETMGMNTGEVQFSGSQAVSVTEWDLLVEPREERNMGESSSREPKKHKPSNGENLAEEASSSATKKKAKGATKKSQRLGPKIAALQRLISPYGKTDAASVLNETATNIKYLHEQIRILSAPYMDRHRQKSLANMGCDLSSRGLCLVPVTPELVNLTSQMASTFRPRSTLTSTRSGPGTTLASTRSVPGSTLASMHTVLGSTLTSTRAVPGSTLASTLSFPGSTFPSTNNVQGSTLASAGIVPGNTLASAGNSFPGSTVPFSNHSIPGSALPFSRFS